jgi:SRSO17 transposase
MKRIVRIPEALNDFFNPLKKHFNVRSFEHFKTMCALMALSSDNKTVRQVSSLISFGAHRSKRNDFLISSPWPEEKVLKDIALKQVKKHYKPGEPLFLILDDSHKVKRGHHVEGTNKIRDHATGIYVTGHRFLTATLYYRGRSIPFAVRAYLKPENAKKLKQPFKKLSTLAVEIIDSLEAPKETKVYILVDTYYTNKPIVKAAEAKGFFVIGALKTNRYLILKGHLKTLKSHMTYLFKRKRKDSRTVTFKKKKYRFFSGRFKVRSLPLKRVTLVFSKMGHRKRLMPILCTDPKLSASSVLKYYAYRWTIEVWFKQAKQHLGLGALHRIRWEGVVKHLHLSACAFGLLTHLREKGEKGKLKTTTAVSSVLPARNELHDLFLEDAIDCFIEKERIKKPKAQVVKLKNYLFPKELTSEAA